MDNFITLPKKDNTLIIYNKITELVDLQFEKLIISHKKLLVRYLYRVILIAYFYFYNNDFINQLYLNNYQDIFSFLVLLLPYYELNSCKNMLSLDELFLNSNSKSKSLSSSYYIDHQEFKSNSDYLEKYFKTNTICILNTMMNIHCSLHPNWLNIFPHTMESYKESDIYKNFINVYEKKFFNNYDEIISLDTADDNFIQLSVDNPNEYFKLGYPKLYGVIYNFLYVDIVPIKWMIYDININGTKILPNIVYLTEKLKLKQIANKPWNKLTNNEKNKNIETWETFHKSTENNFISIKSLVLFYLKWEKDNDNLNELKFPSNCLDLIKTNLENVLGEKNSVMVDDDDDEMNIYINTDKKMEKCLNQILPNIKYDRIYNFIYESVQRFKYTWYGYVCMDEDKNLLDGEEFFSNYFNKYSKIEEFEPKTSGRYKYYYPTPKNIYNFCKALIHTESNNNKYIPISVGPSWSSVSNVNQSNFISKLNRDNDSKLFNIVKNIERTFQTTDLNEKTNIMNRLRNFFNSTSTFVDIICETMIYNGMFTYFKYNPKLTDNFLLPDKNKNFLEWKKYMLANVDIKPYSKSYHQFSNTTLETEIYSNINTIESIKNSMWYTNFGANWVAQIQLYHHFINNRVLYITGATGAGKSTVSPFLLVYAVKIINYKNDAKVVCTQPRTQPTKDNSVRIAESIGYPITIKKDTSLDDVDETYRQTSKDEGVPQNINYIQYKHKKGTLVDELYHPYLRLYTDGSLYNIIKSSYMFKKSIKSYISSIPEFTSSNLFDVILVDEAHEHNTNMDLILTVSKFATYINNQITLGIISATMDDDELIYRKYYEPIDDNWKFPFNMELVDFNKNYIDRRIHLSIPFGGMNFEVKEYPNSTINYPPKLIDDFTNMKKINLSVMEILKHILNTTPGRTNSDILIFQPGEGEIRKLLKEINEQTPPNVIAIPFFSKLDTEILEAYVKKIDKPEVRKKIRYPKNKYEMSQINDIPQSELLPEGTYTRFVILATNIAEASITIDTFEYVIETGNQKINIYDYDTNQSVLKTLPIAVPNQKQRKGRVGRVKPGEVIYTYDRFGLSEKVGYKLNTENISSFVFDLVTETNSQLITSNNDPYKTKNFFNDVKLNFLRTQYLVLINQNYNDFFTIYKTYVGHNKPDISKIIYPYEDGKYQLKTLEDEDGEFFIIHPNEDYFERNPLTLEIINKNKKSNYFNKVDRVFGYGKLTGMVGNDNLMTPYGKLVINLADFMEFSENSVDYTKIILDAFSFNLNKNLLTIRDIIMFIVFKSSKLTLKTQNYAIGKSDYLLMMKQIDTNLFELFGLNDIIKEIRPDMNNFNDIVKNKVNALLYERNFDSNTNIILSNIDGIKNALISYYQIKIKLDIVMINSKNILKKQFDDIFNTLIEQKKQNKQNISDNYLLIINKLILYYIDSKTFMRKNVILRLADELEKISNNDKSKKLSEQMAKKIFHLLSSISIFENENLIKINLDDNKTNSQDIIKQFNEFNEYDKMCFVIIKNFTQNILVKVPYTEFYINYFNRDINNIYSLEIILNKYIRTKVPSDIRNFYIFEVNMNDLNELNNILALSENVILTLDKYFKLQGINLFKKNTLFNNELAQVVYQDKYNDIMKKIDKITEYITKQ